jgi:hypothetical protein
MSPSAPDRQDWKWLLIIGVAGMLLGWAVNAVSPRGFSLLKAAQGSTWMPATDWDDEGDTPTAKGGRP